jgi:hypothetical protein
MNNMSVPAGSILYASVLPGLEVQTEPDSHTARFLAITKGSRHLGEPLTPEHIRQAIRVLRRALNNIDPEKD